MAGDVGRPGDRGTRELARRTTVVQGVGPGTVLGGRYTLRTRLAHSPSIERWTAEDTTLGRPVVVLCVSGQHPNAAAALDAARRAAGVDEPRLVRVHDVGQGDGYSPVSFVVEESLGDARNLTELLAEGGLPSELVRRVVGEAATGLEAARQRGLHHLHLTPASLWVTPEGTVHVQGVATLSALSGADSLNSAVASRMDTVGLLACTYAGLTGRWPLDSRVSGLDPAPKVVGGVPAPSELAAGVPGDLDALCRLTLTQNSGPITPGDLATQIAPWSASRPLGETGAVTPPAPAPAAPEQDPDATNVISLRQQPEVPAAAPVPPAGEVPAALPTVAPSVVAASAAAAAAGADVTADAPEPPPAEPLPTEVAEVAEVEEAPTSSVDAPDALTETSRETSRETSPEPAADPEADRAPDHTRVIPVDPAPASTAWLPVHPDPEETTSGPTGTEVARRDPEGSEGSDDSDDRDAAATPGTGVEVPAALATAAAATGKALESAGRATATAAGAATTTVVSTVGSWGRTARSRIGEARERSRVAGEGSEGSSAEGVARPTTVTEIEPPLPLLPASTAYTPSRQQSRIVLAVMAVLVVVAMVSGLYGVSKIGENSNLFGLTDGPASPEVTVTAPTQTVNPSGQSLGSTVELVGATGFDPEGDNSENNDQADLVVDGKPATGWQSEGYASAKFGGLKKGVGVAVDLGGNRAPTVVTLTLPRTSSGTLFLGPQASSGTGAKAIGSWSAKTGTVRINTGGATTGRFLTIWFTEASSDGKGRYRATLSEVAVTAR